MSDETTTKPEAAAEEDFVLKMQLGIILPMRVKMDGDKPDMEDVHAKAQAVSDALVAHIRNNDVAPLVIHLLEGEAMSIKTWDELKAHAKQQAAAMAQVLQALQNVLPDDPNLEVTVNGMPVGNQEEANQLAAAAQEVFEDQRGEQVTVAGQAAEPVEPDGDTFLVPGTRTLQ